MSKVRMRCARCSKPFKSSDAKQTLCPECATKDRLARARGATQPAAGAKPAPKVVGPAPIITHAPPPPDSGAFGSMARRAEHEERRTPSVPAHTATSHTGASHAGAGHVEAHQQAPHSKHAGHEGSAPAGARAGTAPGASKGAQQPRPPRPPKQPKERAPQPPHELTAEQRAQVEQRYLELAQPSEFDGIRTRIASELGLPKVLVRTAILDLRKSRGLPSWWDLQAFPGTQADLERIRAAYLPLLPVPSVGVHKQIAERLGLESHAVYKGIRQIRAQMGLPQFNPPEEHPEYVAARVAQHADQTPAPAE